MTRLVPHSAVISFLIGAAIVLAAPVLAQGEQKAPDVEGDAVVVELRLSQEVYESDMTMLGELALANRSAEWVSIPPADKLARHLKLLTAEGKSIDPSSPEQFGAAKSDKLGPGGFVGFAFDAGLLFPKMTEPGRYTLVFDPPGVASRSVSVRVLPTFDPALDYRLRL
ncbi:MAG: hypothetical protein JSV80_14990, partial [Acidobacteriota bacterium]